MRTSVRSAAGGSLAVACAALWMLAAPASAVTSFASIAAPNSGVTAGTVVTVTGTGAPASTKFLCVQLVLNPGSSVNYAKTSSLKNVTSNENGAVTCTQTFQPFSGKDDHGVVRHCPLAQADVDAGFSCGVGLADQATFGQTYGSFASYHVVGDAVKKSTSTGKTTTGSTKTKTTTGGTTSTGSTSSTVSGPSSVSSGTGGLADRVGTSTPVLVLAAVVGAALFGTCGWRLVRR